MSKEDRIDYLELERKKLWERLTYLEELVEQKNAELRILIQKKTSDYEAEAKNSAQQTAGYQDASLKAHQTIADTLTEVQSKLSQIKQDSLEFDELFTELEKNAETATSSNESIKLIQKNLETQSEAVKLQLAEIQKIFDSRPILEERLSKLEEIYKSGNDYDSKLNTLYKSITDRKKEIDDLYYEIIGYTETGNDGKETTVAGRKAELEAVYNVLKKKMDDADGELSKLVDDTKKWSGDFSNEKKTEFTNLIEKWTSEYNGVLNKIENLLPNALTTGLSYAYSEKKNVEENERNTHRRSFNWAIGGLVVVSFIPFVVSIVFLYKDMPLEEVVLRIPRLVLAILPLYLPVLWVAYSSNRKMNLAKRLIEEYSHKEVLSKTFEGLSKQINSVDDKDLSFDLRIKLLYNILEVSSENPGKLISDYNKSDHPIMDALDKSVKLTNAVTKLARIPGFTKLASTLAQKADDIVASETKKAEAGLNTLTKDEASKKEI